MNINKITSVLFAIFFPAVTGFTQGVSMSGDLQDPGKSLPRGTFMAVGLSIIVYILSSIIFAATLPADVMMSDYGAMKKVAFFGLLVTAGVIAATLSSACSPPWLAAAPPSTRLLMTV